MVEKRSDDPERRRRDPETLARTEIDDGSTVAHRAARGTRHDARTGVDPSGAGAKPAMLGAEEEGPGGRRLDVASLVLVVVVIALLALLAYALFATHGAGEARAEGSGPLDGATSHAA